MLEIIGNKEKEDGSMTEETVCIGLARVSSETQKIVSGTLKELKDIGKFINSFYLLTNYAEIQSWVHKGVATCWKDKRRLLKRGPLSSEATTFCESMEDNLPFPRPK